MSKGQERESSRKDHIRDGEHLAAAHRIHRATDTWSHQRRDDQRARKGGEKPRTRHLKISCDAVAKDCREVEARCPAQSLSGPKQENNRQAVVRGHASVANLLSAARACAPAYQRDMISMAIHVAIA